MARGLPVDHAVEHDPAAGGASCDFDGCWAMPGSALRPLSASRSAREGGGGVVHSMKLQDACPRPGVAVLAGTLGPLLDVSLLVAALDVCDDRLVHLRRGRGRRGRGLGLRLRRRLVLLCHGEPFPRPWCLCCR
jgi:hypothetical protein